jgi:hypothetical protein
VSDETTPKTAKDFIADMLRDAIAAEQLTHHRLPPRADVEAATTHAETEALYLPFFRWVDAFTFRATTVHVLRRLREIDPTAADEIAAEVWAFMESGDAYPEWIWEWAEQEGIDAQAFSDAEREARAKWLAEPTEYEIKRREAAAS